MTAHVHSCVSMRPLACLWAFCVDRSAVTVGTVWGMDKAWFEEVGAFDDGMLRWGGENLDLAVRVGNTWSR